MKTRVAFPALCLALLFCTSAVQAHHSFSMFQRDVQKVVTGSVTRWAFNNPHSWLYIEVDDGSGESTLWSFEAAAPPQLIGRGVNGATFEPGSTVTVMFCPLVDGRPGGAIGWVRQADGSFVLPNDGGCRVGEQDLPAWREKLERGLDESERAG